VGETGKCGKEWKIVEENRIGGKTSNYVRESEF
jgi:hypothetical protein